MSPQASCQELIARRLFFLLLSLTFNFILLECVHIVLEACSLALDPWFSQAWSLQLLAVDHDPGTEALPSIAHDLELSCDGLQLAR